jgi:hypothetical protein
MERPRSALAGMRKGHYTFAAVAGDMRKRALRHGEILAVNT